MFILKTDQDEKDTICAEIVDKTEFLSTCKALTGITIETDIVSIDGMITSFIPTKCGHHLVISRSTDKIHHIDVSLSEGFLWNGFVVNPLETFRLLDSSILRIVKKYISDLFPESKVQDFYESAHTNNIEVHPSVGKEINKLILLLYQSHVVDDYYSILRDISLLCSLSKLVDEKLYNDFWNYIYDNAFNKSKFLGVTLIEHYMRHTAGMEYSHKISSENKISTYTSAFGLTTDAISQFLKTIMSQ